MTDDLLEIELIDSPPSRSRAALRKIAAASIAIALAIVFFLDYPQLPNNPPRLSLDNSWAMAYHYFSTHGGQAGLDYKFTYGPFYFLLAKLFDPGLYTLHLSARIGVAAVSAIVFVAALFRIQPRPLKVALGLLIFLALPQTGTDCPAFFLLAVETACLVAAVRPSRAEMAAFGIVCGVLALSKFTLFLLSCTSVGVVALAALFQDRPRSHCITAPFAFIASAAAFWIASGQGSNFPDFVIGALQISQAYAQTMGTEIAGWAVYAGALTVFLTLSCVVLRLAHDRTPRSLLLVLYVCALVVLSWKLGLNRPSTGHTRLLFAMNLLGVLFLLDGVAIKKAPIRWAVSALAIAAAAASWFSLRSATSQTIPDSLYRPLVYMTDVARAYAYPSTTRADHEVRYQSLKRLYDLPIIRETVGQATVDMYPPAQASLFLNGLNYHPRPVFQGYQAGTLALLEGNGAFYRSARAPEFIVFEVGALDGRFMGMEDSQALIAIMTHYDFDRAELPYLLYKRRVEPQSIQHRSSKSYIEHWNEWRDAPAGEDWALASVKAQHSPLGKLRGQLLRPAQFYIEAELSDGAIVKHRMNGCAALPFIFQPYLEAGLAVMGHDPGLATRRIVRFRFITDAGFESHFEPEIPVKLDLIAPLR